MEMWNQINEFLNSLNDYCQNFQNSHFPQNILQNTVIKHASFYICCCYNRGIESMGGQADIAGFKYKEYSASRVKLFGGI